MRMCYKIANTIFSGGGADCMAFHLGFNELMHSAPQKCPHPPPMFVFLIY